MFASVNVDSDICQYVQSLNAGKVKIPVKSHDNPDETTTTVSFLMLLCKQFRSLVSLFYSIKNLCVLSHI